MTCFRRYYSSFKIGFLFILCCGLQSCATAPQKDLALLPPSIPIVYYPEFGERPAQTSEQELFKLTSAQEKEFLAYYNHPFNRDEIGHKRVSNYLEKVLKSFNYHSDTFMASEAAETMEGNCLSLAILTTALARVANIEVGYELMRTPPVYQKKGNTILSSQHVRSILYEPVLQERQGFLFSFQPVIKIDYFPTAGTVVQRKVFEREFISMYFRNKAAEALIENRQNDAFWFAEESLKYSENNAHATNMLALVYDNKGFDKDAEKLFQFGIEHSREKLELLSNYHRFLLRKERFDEAKQIQEQIAEIDDPNPFDWLEMADHSFATGDYDQALRYYNKVVDLAPYLHYGYFGLGKIEFLRGNNRRAKKALSKAAELAIEVDTQAMYLAKLAALTSSFAKN